MNHILSIICANSLQSLEVSFDHIDLISMTKYHVVTYDSAILYLVMYVKFCVKQCTIFQPYYMNTYIAKLHYNNINILCCVIVFEEFLSLLFLSSYNRIIWTDIIFMWHNMRRLNVKFLTASFDFFILFQCHNLSPQKSRMVHIMIMNVQIL